MARNGKAKLPWLALDDIDSIMMLHWPCATCHQKRIPNERITFASDVDGRE